MSLRLVIDAVIHDMTMWIVRVVMPYDDELSIFLSPSSACIQGAILAMSSSVKRGLSSGLKLNAMCPTGFLILGFSCLCGSKLCVISAFVPSKHTIETMIFASSLPVHSGCKPPNELPFFSLPIHVVSSFLPSYRLASVYELAWRYSPRIAFNLLNKSTHIHMSFMETSLMRQLGKLVEVVRHANEILGDGYRLSVVSAHHLAIQGGLSDISANLRLAFLALSLKAS